MHKATRQGGFTLLELLITVSILGIIAVVGASAYQDYSARAEASEFFRMAEGLKSDYEIAFAENGGAAHELTADVIPGAVATDFAGKYVEQLGVNNGVIYGVFRSTAATPLAGTQISLTPYVNNAGMIVWHCGNAADPTESDGVTALTRAPTGWGATPGTPIAKGTTSTPDAVLPKLCRTGS